MQQITLVIHREDDGWWAEAPGLPGFSAAAPTIDSLRIAAREGLAFHLDDAPFELFELAVDHTPRLPWRELVTTSVGVAQGIARATFGPRSAVVSEAPVFNAGSGAPAPAMS